MHTPSSRRRRKEEPGLNLNSILDAIFILIFFLLASAQFIKIFEISSDVPTTSEKPPPPSKKKPLALTLRVTSNTITVMTGVPSVAINSFKRDQEGNFDYEGLHTFLFGIKKKHLKEDTVVIEPSSDVSYEDIVKIMDAARHINNTDESLFRTNKEGIEEKIEILFNNIVFGNILS